MLSSSRLLFIYYGKLCVYHVEFFVPLKISERIIYFILAASIGMFFFHCLKYCCLSTLSHLEECSLHYKCKQMMVLNFKHVCLECFNLWAIACSLTMKWKTCVGISCFANIKHFFCSFDLHQTISCFLSLSYGMNFNLMSRGTLQCFPKYFWNNKQLFALNLLEVLRNWLTERIHNTYTFSIFVYSLDVCKGKVFENLL